MTTAKTRIPYGSMRKIHNLIPKGAKLISYGLADKRITIGTKTFAFYEFTYEHEGQEYKSRIKAFKI